MTEKVYFTGLPSGSRSEHGRLDMKVGTRYEIASNDGEWVTVPHVEEKLPVSCFPYLDPKYQIARRTTRTDPKLAAYLADRWGCTRESTRYLWPSMHANRMQIMMKGARLPLKTDAILSMDELPVAAIVAATGWSEYTLKGWLGKPRYAARLWDIMRGLDGGVR